MDGHRRFSSVATRHACGHRHTGVSYITASYPLSQHWQPEWVDIRQEEPKGGVEEQEDATEIHEGA
jgi:hypothetical protein